MEQQKVSRAPGRRPVEIRMSESARDRLEALALEHKILDHMKRPNRSEVARRLMARGLASLKPGEMP